MKRLDTIIIFTITSILCIINLYIAFKYNFNGMRLRIDIIILFSLNILLLLYCIKRKYIDLSVINGLITTSFIIFYIASVICEINKGGDGLGTLYKDVWHTSLVIVFYITVEHLVLLIYSIVFVLISKNINRKKKMLNSEL